MAVYLNFGNTFNAVSYIILTDKMIKDDMDQWRGRWTENCLGVTLRGLQEVQVEDSHEGSAPGTDSAIKCLH